jgi:hypothetical protein
VFRSLVDLRAAIKRFLAETNDKQGLFVWTADPDKIIAAVKRGYQAVDSIHWMDEGVEDAGALPNTDRIEKRSAGARRRAGRDRAVGWGDQPGRCQ